MSKNSSHNYWEAFGRIQSSQIGSDLFFDNLEYLRFQCLVGFTALEASLNYYWQECVLPEWPDTISLANSVLSNAEALDLLTASSRDSFSRSQWLSTLSFLAHQQQPELFSPNLADIACMMALKSAQQDLSSFTRILFQLHRLKPACTQFRQTFGEGLAQRILELLADFKLESAKIHPLFFDLFPDEDLNQLKAA